ncbi:MAG: hypothetical protein HY042_05045, partial [Spirochaetia bacterium]|nr:hypothetical protein [Spirochaetia bacterium]
MKTQTATAFFVLSLLAGGGSLSAQEATPTPLERFTFRGDMLARGFYLERDLPLKSVSLNTTTKTSEIQDLYSMRYRLDLAFRPSQNVDVQYGLQVGELTFGRDTPSSTGHGSGGLGSGSTNVETRELIMKIRNNPETTSVSFGILNFDTPRGLVLASSGGGARLFFDLPSLASSVDVYYIRALDNSVIDGDSNGFSDKNFSNVNLGLARYRFTGIKNLRSEAYMIYRQDDDAQSALDGGETSRMYWGGLFAQYKKGAYGLLFHAVGNWGQFHRPDTVSPYLRKRYEVKAGAGQLELSAAPWDELQVTLVAAGASGRLGIEPNGRSVDFRQDQFRTVSGQFQLTDIVMDSSGGYTVFAAGKLTGVVAEG